MAEGDLDGVMHLAGIVHPAFPERREVFAEKRALYPEGCLVLPGGEGRLLGYAVAHPWPGDEIAPLDTFLVALPPMPAPLWIHDVALAPEARGAGLAAPLVSRLLAGAVRAGAPSARLVSVYGTRPWWQRHGFMACDPASLAPAVTGKLRAVYGDEAVLMERALAA